MIRFLDSSCLGTWTVRFQDSSCLGARRDPGLQLPGRGQGARRVGFLDFSCLATLAGWTDVFCWALLREVGDGKGWML